MHDDVKLYFGDAGLLKNCVYSRVVEKARSAVEVREYWQTEDIAWLPQKKDWGKIKSIAMTRNTITKGDKTTVETRYFISSLGISTDEKGNKTADEISRAIRKHWMVESYHHHLDVTFKKTQTKPQTKMPH